MADEDLSTHWEETEGQAAKDTAAAAKSTADAAQSAADSAKTYACSCSTAGSTAAKVAGADGFALATGSQVAVTFAEANTAASPTLNVNSTGAKAIRLNGAGYAYWMAGATVALVYDGSYWQVCNTPLYGSTATIGNPGGGNVYIDSDSVDVRKGTSTLATFGADSKFSFMRTTGNTFITTTSGDQIAFGQHDKSTGDVDDVFLGLLNNSTSGHSAPIIGMRAPYIMVQTDVYPLDNLRRAVSQTVLYNGGAALDYGTNPGAGTTGTVTLRETAANFAELTISYQYDVWARSSVTLTNPSGKTAGLYLMFVGADGNLWIKTRNISISGTSITNATKAANLAFSLANGACLLAQSLSTPEIIIDRVEGRR